jgi:hypothetical protein
MSIKPPVVAMVAAAFCAVVGSASVSAQENCGSMYQRVMEAYQVQSPHYGQMLNRYTVQCLSGGSSRPAWRDDYRHRYVAIAVATITIAGVGADDRAVRRPLLGWPARSVLRNRPGWSA